MSFLSDLMGKALSFLGTTFAATGSQACVLFWLDEPEMPKAMLDSDK